jgi:hypothetical protein
LPLILLKGAAYAMAGLAPGAAACFPTSTSWCRRPPAGGRSGADAARLGRSTHHDAYDQRYYREWMHELPPMEHVRRGNVIDVHHAILPETAALRPDPASCARRGAGRPACPAWPRCCAGAADMVLHSAVHLFFDGEFDKGCATCSTSTGCCAIRRRPGFWPALPARAANWSWRGRCSMPCATASACSARRCRTRCWMRGAGARRAEPALLALMDRCSCARCCRCTQLRGPFHGLARFALYVRGNWLRMPPLLLARHLFHKAFISPRTERPSTLRRIEGGLTAALASAVRIAYY